MASHDTFPDHYLPMLAPTCKEPFNHPDWIWEVKWDGYRMMAYVQKEKIELRFRNNKNHTKRFNIIADDLKTWKHEALEEKRVPKNHICFINTENPVFGGMGLDELFQTAMKASGNENPKGWFVFFDEVQYLKDWEVHLVLVDSLSLPVLLLLHSN